jgi:hypothetical protein
VGRVVAIVIDRSASMGVEEGGRPRIDLAREAALNVLASLRGGDRVVVQFTPAGDEEGAAAEVPGAPTTELQAVARAISDVRVTTGQADFAGALVRAAAAMEPAAGAGAREVVVVSDRQGRNWQQVNDAFAKQWRAAAPAGGGGEAPRVTWIPVGAPGEENVGIDGIDVLAVPVVRSQAADVEVRLRNYGHATRGPLRVTLSAGGRELAVRAVTLDPGQRQSVRIPVTFSESGPAVLTARVEASDVPFDNVRQWVVEVVERLPVLIVSGDERPGAFRSESDFLRLALEPFGKDKAEGGRQKDEGGVSTAPVGNADRNPCVVTVTPVDKWADLDLAKYRAVVLANVPVLTPAQVRALEQYVYGGGGLAVAPGNLVRAEEYNRALYRGGTGLLPTALAEPVPPTAAAASLLGIDLGHPVFGFLKGTSDPVPAATVGRYFPIGGLTGSARAIASFSTGSPFLVEGSFGRGRVVLVTSPLDADWGTLPLSNFFLPFAQSLVRYLASAGAESRNVAPGEALVATLAADVDERSVRVKRPDGKTDFADVTRIGGRLEARYGRTAEAGAYTVSGNAPSGPAVVVFAVQPPSDESDLTGISNEQVRVLRDGLGVDVVEAGSVRVAGAAVGGRGSRELWGACLLGVFVLVGAEMYLARAWGLGRGR